MADHATHPQTTSNNIVLILECNEGRIIGVATVSAAPDLRGVRLFTPPPDSPNLLPPPLIFTPDLLSP